ncbi:MAG: hypothetical protein JRI36_05050 [Deltaproteobacteria bacterium]|nr:hypothetical protein [Deltaproteobacteria bacterium]
MGHNLAGSAVKLKRRKSAVRVVFLVCLSSLFVFRAPDKSLSAVLIWDKDSSAWTEAFSAGDPVDTGKPYNAGRPQSGVDSNDIVYVTYIQADGSDNDHVYLSRWVEPATVRSSSLPGGSGGGGCFINTVWDTLRFQPFW